MEISLKPSEQVFGRNLRRSVIARLQLYTCRVYIYTHTSVRARMCVCIMIIWINVISIFRDCSSLGAEDVMSRFEYSYKTNLNSCTGMHKMSIKQHRNGSPEHPGIFNITNTRQRCRGDARKR